MWFSVIDAFIYNCVLESMPQMSKSEIQKPILFQSGNIN